MHISLVLICHEQNVLAAFRRLGVHRCLEDLGKTSSRLAGSRAVNGAVMLASRIDMRFQ
jgi:hypothetical protein